ncbi:YpzG family protein [Falsibacillus pallidus]|uniref:YpzG-like protein n=1 Tax=Falsibacillus pallidus TaxID=493781 RepID=A0A370G533_9BACI|nr:YpzG family protein [Falsibacillus pallidus]RDI37163.1 YpzG-like protein [Falsibacillus pallidus]
MDNVNNNFSNDRYNSPFNKAWFNKKHAHAQANGETRITQKQIILANETRKRS